MFAMRKPSLVVGLTLTAALLAACGGGSDSSSTSAVTSSGELSKSEWISQADGVCRTYRDETQDLTAKFEALDISSSSPSKDLVKGSELLRQIDTKSAEETDALRQLEPPSGDEETIDAMLAKVEETRDIGLQAADALEDGDESALQDIVGEGNEINAEAKEMAKDYGLKVCGS
jgi:hypothetical protein